MKEDKDLLKNTERRILLLFLKDISKISTKG